jgi:hypothetical protein
MLFDLSSRYRKDNINLKGEKYVLYLKWGKNGKHSEYGRFDTKDGAIEAFMKLNRLGSKKNYFGDELSEDYRIKLIKQTYSEEKIDVPTFKSLSDKLPELKGIF